MHAAEHIAWLEKNNLLERAKSAVPALKKVFTDCLDAKDEDVLIIGDTGFEGKRVSAVVAGAYYLAAKELKLNASLIVQEPKFRGDTADNELMDRLYEFKPRNIAVLALSNKPGSIGDLGESFRTYAKEKKHRFISALSLGHLNTDQLPALINAIDVDYAELARKGKELKARLEQGKELHITTSAGTDLYMGIEGKKAIANVGSYKLPGSGGNIPAGEVYIPPKWKNVEGKVVIDGSCAYRGGTILVNEPIRIKIEKDEIVSIKGGDEAEKLQSTLDWAAKKSKYPWGVRRIGELGIGINEKAGIVGATIIDEKTLGTAHIGIGSNHWFGGTIYAIIHLDQVFKNPKIEIDGELLEIQ